MGMSATQARLLQLTAQLNDVEFEGQQINMARTQLSSTSATYYNQLLNMEVPTPPNKTDYTNIVYSYTAGGTDYNVASIGPLDENFVATINVQSTQVGVTIGDTHNTSEITWSDEILSAVDSGETIVTANKGELYSVMSPVKAATGYTPGAVYYDALGNIVTEKIKNAVNTQVVAGGYLKPDGTPATEYVAGLKNANGEEVTADEFAACVTGYYQSVSEGEAEFYIGSKAQANRTYYSGGRELISLGDPSLDNSDNAVIQNLKTAITNAGEELSDYYVVSDGNNGYKCFKRTDVEDNDGVANEYTSTSGEILVDEEIEGAYLEFDSNGRLAALTLPNSTQRLAVTSKTEVDDLAYEEAYTNYTYKKMVYNRDQAAINAQLSTIQSQDKRLELQLTELDTRRTQITTELDALNTVLGDNVERTYKTFSG